MVGAAVGVEMGAVGASMGENVGTSVVGAADIGLGKGAVVGVQDEQLHSVAPAAYKVCGIHGQLVKVLAIMDATESPITIDDRLVQP